MDALRLAAPAGLWVLVGLVPLVAMYVLRSFFCSVPPNFLSAPTRDSR